MQTNNIFSTNTVSYRDKFTVKSNAGVLNFDDFTKNIESTNAITSVSNVESKSEELVMPKSSAILKSEVKPNIYGTDFFSSTITTTFNGPYEIQSYVGYQNFLPVELYDRFLGTFSYPNQTAYSYQYSEDSTDERPLAEVKHVDENGVYIEQLIDIYAVDPSNCTTTEFSALYLHSLKQANEEPDNLLNKPYGLCLGFSLDEILCNQKGLHQFDHYPTFDEVQDYMGKGKALANFNMSLPFKENNEGGEEMLYVLELFDKMKNELADTFIENDALFESELNEFDEQIQKQYEYSRWLKL